MALESLPKIAPALFSAEQDLIQIYNKKSDTVGTINASYIGGSTPPSGVSGAIQFSNGSAFASDSANLFWDDTNNRLGVGTNAPTGKLQVTESFTTTGNNYSAITFDGTLTSRATASDTIFGFRNTQSIVATATGQTIIANDLTPNYSFFDANTDSIALRIGGLKNTQNNATAILMQQTASAGNNGLAIQPANSRWQMGYIAGQGSDMGTNPRVVYGASGIRISTNSSPAYNLFEIQGSGTTSGTTSLLVQNSVGTAALTIKDDLSATFGGTAVASAFAGTGYFSLTSELRLVIGVAPNRTLFIPIGSGILCMSDGAETDFNRLQFGGTTSSYPSLKRNGTAIDVRLADDSNYAGFNTGATTIKGSGSTSATLSLVVQNSAGANLFRIRDDGNILCEGGGAISSVGIIGTVYGLFGGASYEPSASLVCGGTTQGFLPPRMTDAQIRAIVSPANGLVAYNTDINHLCCYQNGAWAKFSHSPM